jgi:TctA family transporter
LAELFGFDGWTQAIVALVVGTGLGFLYGLIPGMGGRMGVILSLPLATAFDPYPAAIFLFSLHAVDNTSSAIPNIALGMPSSGSSDAATILDGYPLAKMGRAGEALGASLSGSAIGGVLGAVTFLIAIPIARPLVTSFGPPELLMLALIGIAMVASLSSEGLFQGLVVAALGMIAAMVGLDPRTGSERFTFGSMDMWDGLKITAIVCGLFVVPEMLTSKRHADDQAHHRAISTTIKDVFRGMFVTFHYRAVVLRSTFYGILAGVTPAVGSSVGVWMAYAHAARTTKSEIPFGKGAIAGVIAPETANNSKEGGAMIPTLFFGIPGSSGMAIMMGALGVVGVAVGPNMLTRDIGLSFALAFTVMFANLLAIPAFFLVIPAIVRLAAVRRDAIAPIAITLSFTAALISSPTFFTIGQVFAAGLLGVALKQANWPRAPFILGFVVAEMAEGAYFQTAGIYGWSALARPLTAGLLLTLVIWLALSVRRRSPLKVVGPRRVTLVLAVCLVAVFAATIGLSVPLPIESGLAPMAISAFGLVLCLAIAMVALRRGGIEDGQENMLNVGLAGLLVLSTPIIGLIPASVAFIAAFLKRSGLRLRSAIAVALAIGGLQVLLLATVFDVLVERELIGRIAWWSLGY